MAHLQEAMQRMADNDPSIQKIRVIPVGTIVQYFGRSGAMRQGRTVFSGVVIHQHPDDGSLDLIIWFEAEDHIWEQRVRQRSDTQPDHCWDFVPPVETGTKPDYAAAFEHIQSRLDHLEADIKRIELQMYGSYEVPDKSMIEYLADFEKQLKKLERKLIG